MPTRAATLCYGYTCYGYTYCGVTASGFDGVVLLERSLLTTLTPLTLLTPPVPLTLLTLLVLLALLGVLAVACRPTTPHACCRSASYLLPTHYLRTAYLLPTAMLQERSHTAERSAGVGTPAPSTKYPTAKST